MMKIWTKMKKMNNLVNRFLIKGVSLLDDMDVDEEEKDEDEDDDDSGEFQGIKSIIDKKKKEQAEQLAALGTKNKRIFADFRSCS